MAGRRTRAVPTLVPSPVKPPSVASSDSDSPPLKAPAVHKRKATPTTASTPRPNKFVKRRLAPPSSDEEDDEDVPAPVKPAPREAPTPTDPTSNANASDEDEDELGPLVRTSTTKGPAKRSGSVSSDSVIFTPRQTRSRSGSAAPVTKPVSVAKPVSVSKGRQQDKGKKVAATVDNAQLVIYDADPEFHSRILDIAGIQSEVDDAYSPANLPALKWDPFNRLSWLLHDENVVGPTSVLLTGRAVDFSFEYTKGNSSYPVRKAYIDIAPLLPADVTALNNIREEHSTAPVPKGGDVFSIWRWTAKFGEADTWFDSYFDAREVFIGAKESRKEGRVLQVRKDLQRGDIVIAQFYRNRNVFKAAGTSINAEASTSSGSPRKFQGGTSSPRKGSEQVGSPSTSPSRSQADAPFVVDFWLQNLWLLKRGDPSTVPQYGAGPSTWRR